ncbi:antibiotic biosynthesis monooxygenase family protein [Lentiprolixibacter aurantiacus]|uniref:Antibiotic biosynthesis monooxygenase n=1 Tax=Lentiprolixibacter aurantiacus TaxID=2993939 RepID=A0AAE3SMJ3_9FLAO|nr:antibiotic biosynthesis monooxygenase [Lentiprolixibacter aurantiacus]MCX2718351.1 antibiotic biosynthesis monooxygenase [Lentiprolixibacter aurantiacus]
MKAHKPYYAVIFSNALCASTEGYRDMAGKMEELAKNQPGYLGFETAREETGISISYWDSLEAIAAWKANVEHEVAQAMGIKEWYQWYKVRICQVLREYNFNRE